MFAEAAKGDFRFEVCDLGQEEVPAAAWLELAGQAACTVRRPQTADKLQWALVEALTGTPSLAATEVKLHVDFNPRAVAAYRLIGHDSTRFGGLLPAAVETDLHVGQTASALFEVWLYPNEEDDVATVRVQWSDPASGKSRQAGPQRVSRLQFATAFEGSALSLQASAIAAEAAEVLKQAFNFGLIAPDRYGYEPKPSGLEHVLVELGRPPPGWRNSRNSGGSSSCWKPCPGWAVARMPSQACSGRGNNRRSMAGVRLNACVDPRRLASCGGRQR